MSPIPARTVCLIIFSILLLTIVNILFGAAVALEFISCILMKLTKGFVFPSVESIAIMFIARWKSFQHTHQ